MSKNWLSDLSRTLLIVKITNAPIATPQKLPMPPSTTMARTVNETTNVNWSGLTVTSFEALNTPAIPAVDAPRAKASSLATTVLMPLAAAASSSSRIASHARPIRLSMSR